MPVQAVDLVNKKAHLSVSILICSRNRRDDLEKIVHQLRNMAARHPFDLVVVEETDEPRALRGVRYYPHPVKNLGFAYARNLSISHATGEIMVFIDDDCLIHDGWLDNLLRPFEDDSVVGVQGGVVVPDGTNAVGWAESILGFPGGGVKRIIEAGGSVRNTIEISTLNCAYRRSVIESIGGFSDRLKWGGEDYILAKKAARHGKCCFVPSAAVCHRARESFRGIWKWFIRRGRAEIGVVRSREHPPANRRSVLKSSFLTKLAAICCLGVIIPSGWILTPLFLLFYCLLQYCRNFRVWKKTPAPFRSFLILPFVKLAMDIAMDTGRIKELLSD